MSEDLNNLLITIISGVGVFVFSQWYTEFILQPIKEYKQLKAKVAKQLILHAQYYCNPWVYGAEGDCAAWKFASQEIRELAAEVAAFAEINLTELSQFGMMAFWISTIPSLLVFFLATELVHLITELAIKG